MPAPIFSLELRRAFAAIILLIILTGLSFWQWSTSEESPIIPPIQYVPRPEIMHGDTSKKQVIFTFDGGEGPQSGDQILDVLARHHIQGTFFLTGKFVENHTDLVRKIALGGHEIFNHTYDHPHLTSVTDEGIVTQLAKMNGALEQVIGSSTRPYFRAPYGDRDERVLSVAGTAGYRSVYWTTDALDWQETQGIGADEVKNRILSGVTSGAIFLMHIGDTITGAILDEVFTQIEAQGYRIVSLTQGL